MISKEQFIAVGLQQRQEELEKEYDELVARDKRERAEREERERIEKEDAVFLASEEPVHVRFIARLNDAEARASMAEERIELLFNAQLMREAEQRAWDEDEVGLSLVFFQSQISHSTFPPISLHTI